MQTEGLLKQSQQLARELQSQQKELQQTNEQLAQKARELADQNAEVERKNRENSCCCSCSRIAAWIGRTFSSALPPSLRPQAWAERPVTVSRKTSEPPWAEMMARLGARLALPHRRRLRAAGADPGSRQPRRLPRW